MSDKSISGKEQTEKSQKTASNDLLLVTDETFSSKAQSTTESNLDTQDVLSLMSTMERLQSERTISAFDVQSSQSISNFDIDGDEDLFLETDMEELEPSLMYKERGFIKLKGLYEKITTNLTNSQNVNIPLEEVKEQFAYIWECIEQSHLNELDLINKDRNITSALAELMARTHMLIKLAEDDPKVAAKLGRRLEAAWGLVDIGEEDEKRTTEKIDVLTEEIFTLNRNIALAATLEGLDQMNDLNKVKRRLGEEKDLLLREGAKLRSAVNVLKEKKAQVMHRNSQFQDTIKLGDEELNAQNDAIVRETARKEKIMSDNETLRISLEAKEKDLAVLRNKAIASRQKVLDTEKSIKEQKLINEAAARDAEISGSRMDKLRAEFESETQLVNRLNAEVIAKGHECKTREHEVFSLKQEILRVSRQRNSNVKRNSLLEATLKSVEKDRDILKQKIAILEKELERVQKKFEENKRHMEEMDKQRSALNRNLHRAKALAADHDSQVKTHESAVHNLENELIGYHKEIELQLNMVHRLEKERDFYSHEATKLAHYVALHLEEIKKTDLTLFQYRKTISNVDTILKKQQQSYETALYDKSLAEKNLRELQTEISNTKTTIRYLDFDVKGLRYQLQDKERQLRINTDKHDYMLKEIKFLKQESNRIERMALDLQHQIVALGAERSTLGCATAEAESELSKQIYYKNAADVRRQTYRKKLMVKNLELQKISEQWRTQHSIIRIGTYHYRKILREIRQMRQRIVNLRRVHLQVDNNSSGMNDLRREIAVLEGCITKEKCMCNSLEDQLSLPINVHRWRSLEAVAPDAYDMVQKINLVTKRLVERNAEIVKHSEVMQEKEKILVEIKSVVRHAPGLEVPEELRYYQQLLVAKKKQLKTLTDELLAAEGQTKYYRNEISSINKKYEALKKAYFKRRQNQLKQFKKNCNGDENSAIELAEIDENEQQPEEYFEAETTENSETEAEMSELPMTASGVPSVEEDSYDYRGYEGEFEGE